MELTERIDLLLGMKERANGAYYRAYDCDTAINIVNAQAESESLRQPHRLHGAITSRFIKTPVRHEQGDRAW